MNRRLSLWLLRVLAAVDLGLAAAVWSHRPWVNGPPEWRWQFTAPERPSLAAILVLALALALLGAVVLHRRAAAARWALPLLIAAGAAFTFALVAGQPGGFARVTAALVSRNSFGYLWDASLAPPNRALLADYPAASADLNQHSVTHPPGPLLAARALGWLDRILPPPASPSSLPGLAAAAVDHEVVRARRHGRPVPPSPPGAWSTTAFALLLPFLSALAAWPLHRLARRLGSDRPQALAAAALWLLVPARSLFTPSFDQALPLPLLAAACLAAASVQVPSAAAGRRFSRVSWPAAAAGLLLFACCFLSYGCVTALPLIVVMPLLGAWAGHSTLAPPADAPGTRPETHGAGAHSILAAPAEPAWRRAGHTFGLLLRAVNPAVWVSLALGFALPYLVLAAAFGHNPWRSMRVALDLHRQIAVATRSYTTWLLWNPYDFALLLSPGLAALAALALAPTSAAPTAAAPTPRAPLTAAAARAALAWIFWMLLAGLWISGGVRGEAGRIWLIWMPFACLLAAGLGSGRPTPRISSSATADPAAAGTPAAGAAHRAAWAALLAAQAVLILALAANLVFVG